MMETAEIICAKCRTPMQRQHDDGAKPRDSEIVSCKKCNISERYDRVLAEVTAYLKCQVKDKLLDDIENSLAGCSVMTFKRGAAPKQNFRFITGKPRPGGNIVKAKSTQAFGTPPIPRQKPSYLVQPLQWVNPTGGAIRGTDTHGSGKFGAPRSGKGSMPRTHTGTDYVATVGQEVIAVLGGEITKIGFPYQNNFHHKYIKVSDQFSNVVRHLYVEPYAHITIGTTVAAGEPIGTYQGLFMLYRGITEHDHIDIQRNGQYVDPASLIP